MEFKSGDFIVLSEYGLNMLYKDLHYKEVNRMKKIMKTTLFKMSEQINQKSIYINDMSGKAILSRQLADNFRLATSMEIKLYTMKSIMTTHS